MPSATPVRRGARPAAALTTTNGNGAGALGRQTEHMKTIETLLSSPAVKHQLSLALPAHLTPDRLARIALTEVRKNPDLASCNTASFLGAIMQAAQLGLELGVNGAGFLVPYKGACTFVPGWKGLVDLVSRSGRASVWTGAVFQGDQFDYALGDKPFVRHLPGDESDPDKLTHVYAIGRVKGSEYPLIEVWTMAKVWKHRDRYNKQGMKHYSYRNEEMYARKIPLLQVIKYLPSSIELATVLDLNDAAERGQQQDHPLSFLNAGQEQGAVASAAAGAAALPQAQAEPMISEQQLTQLQLAITRRLNVIGEAALLADLLQQDGVDGLENLPVSSFDPLMRSLADKGRVENWNGGNSSTGEPLLSQEQINELVDQAQAADEAEAAELPAEQQASFV